MAMATKGKGYYNIGSNPSKKTKIRKKDKGVIKEKDLEEISDGDIKKENYRASNRVYSLDFASKMEDKPIKEELIEDDTNAIDPEENKENLEELKDKEALEKLDQTDPPSEDDKDIDTEE